MLRCCSPCAFQSLGFLRMTRLGVQGCDATEWSTRNKFGTWALGWDGMGPCIYSSPCDCVVHITERVASYLRFAAPLFFEAAKGPPRPHGRIMAAWPHGRIWREDACSGMQWRGTDGGQLLQLKLPAQCATLRCCACSRGHTLPGWHAATHHGCTAQSEGTGFCGWIRSVLLLLTPTQLRTTWQALQASA